MEVGEVVACVDVVPGGRRVNARVVHLHGGLRRAVAAGVHRRRALDRPGERVLAGAEAGDLGLRGVGRLDVGGRAVGARPCAGGRRRILVKVVG